MKIGSIFDPSYIICGVFGLYTHFPLHTPYPILSRPAGSRRQRGSPTPRCPPCRPGPGALLSTSVPAPEPRCSIHRRGKTAYFQSLLYNMRGFCLLHTLSSTHTFTPSCLGRQDHVASAVPPLLDAHQVAQVLERDCPPQCQHRSRAVAYTDVERRPIFNPSYIICGVFCLLHTLPSTHTFTPSCLGRQHPIDATTQPSRSHPNRV